MNYQVVSTAHLDEFVKKCRELTREGYTPAGGISTTLNAGGCIHYTQAFTKPLQRC